MEILSHPHVAQCYEVYNGHPIFYSLGNFCFDNVWKDTPKGWFEGLIANIIIDDANMLHIEAIPVMYEQAKGLVSENKSEDFLRTLENLNILFMDDDMYLGRIEQYISEKAHIKDVFLNGSGYFKYNPKAFLRMGIAAVIRKLRRRNIPSYVDAQLVNLARCEAHRWVLSANYDKRTIQEL